MTPSNLVTFQAFWKGEYQRSDGWQVSKVIVKNRDKIERASASLNLQFDGEQEQSLTFKWKVQGCTMRDEQWTCSKKEAKTLQLYAHLFSSQLLEGSRDSAECDIPIICEIRPTFEPGRTYILRCSQVQDRLTASVQSVDIVKEETKEDECRIM